LGHDISPIGNHNLNTASLKELAEDIVSRIDINIEYGYFGQKEYFKLLGRERDNGLIIIDSIIKHKDFKTFRLIDDSYQLKELHHKFGDDLFYNPEYWIYYEGKLPEENTIRREKEEMMLPDFTLEHNKENECERMTINKETYHNSAIYISGWWTFCRFFIVNYEDDRYLKALLDFRNVLKGYTFKFGGSKMYYLDDQSHVLEEVGQGDEWELSWKEFENIVHEKTSHLMIDIPKFMTDEKYRSNFQKLDEWPLSFRDDFKDLIE